MKYVNPRTIGELGVFLLAKHKIKTNVHERERKNKYDAKRAGQRTRNWTAVVYPDDVPPDWEKLITGVKWVRSPFHNADFNADGTPKKPHYHILLMWSAVKTADQVSEYLAGIFGTSDGGSIIGVATPQRVTDRGALVRYFAHIDHPDKTQYDTADIIGYNGADVLELLQHNKSEIAAMLADIEQFIDDNEITELCDLSAALRQFNIDWYLLVSTQHTYYFDAYVRSRRHKLLAERENEKTTTRRKCLLSLVSDPATDTSGDECN